ncbi:MAG: hypothetical protein HKP55_00615 [Gammaproteobacteria bacterium]|nr:hypothetical protein [Gammaproteobacteria bacterium]
MAKILTDEGTEIGTRYDEGQDLSAAVEDALTAAEINASRDTTQVFDKIITSVSNYGNGGMNVINIEGIDYKKSSVATPLALTLIGGSEDLFVLNVGGKFVLGPNSSIRGSDLVDPSRVLINIQEGNTPAQFAANHCWPPLIIVRNILRKMQG